MPTEKGSSFFGFAGLTQPFAKAVSVMYFSTEPIVTLLNLFSMKQFP